MAQGNLLERKGDKRPFPIIDDHIAVGRLWGLFIYPIVLFTILAYASGEIHVDSQTEWLLSFAILPMILFLGGYWLISGQVPWKLFHRVSGKEWRHTLLLFLLQLIYSGLIQIIFAAFQAKTQANANAAQIGGPDRWPLFFQSTFSDLFSLMNEEIVAIGVFLAFAAILLQQFHLKRNVAIWSALGVSMFVFGMVHFVTYDWNIPQMLFVIGVSRLFVTGSYIYSKSIWTSFAMHFTLDTAIFLLATLAAH
ncbi:CPBP family glutamic-type intramembrane protease [Furfurilactobacillus curtus]|uniref:CAAX prenyl protease 2/Lysostaphin resistance protein A-like domain-containing protein n=1 Tax=Furfurilactobacillus curtus TaxID=1746200 RepID=A0ABQ5JRZ0_9LACO